jgi:hypothetical protein
MCYEQTRDSGGFEPFHSRRRPNLQWHSLAGHFLADHYAGLLDRQWRIVGLGVSSYRGLYSLFIREKGGGSAPMAETLKSEICIQIRNFEYKTPALS